MFFEKSVIIHVSPSTGEGGGDMEFSDRGNSPP